MSLPCVLGQSASIFCAFANFQEDGELGGVDGGDNWEAKTRSGCLGTSCAFLPAWMPLAKFFFTYLSQFVACVAPGAVVTQRTILTR